MATDTKNFKVREFACKCCGRNEVAQEVLNMCQAIREELGVAVTINSGYRCERHNAEVGGVKGSYHTRGKAADLSCSLGGLKIFLAVHKLHVLGRLPELCYCIYYIKKNFVHIDCGGKRESGNIFEVRA